MKNPLVTIIVPTLNAVDLIDQTLASLVEQPSEIWECIVVDGVSSDGTVEKIAQWALRFHGALRWISEPDQGVYDAFNRGIALARGTYIYFLGAGDYLQPNVLANLLPFLAKNPELLYGDVKNIRTDSYRVGGIFSPLRLATSFMWHQGIFYHRDLFTQLGSYNLRYTLYADAVFNLRAFSTVKTIPLYSGLTIASYHGAGLSASDSGHKDLIFAMDLLGLVRDYLGEKACHACIDSGFAFNVYLRNSKSLNLLIAGSVATTPIFLDVLQQRAAQFKTDLQVNTISLQELTQVQPQTADAVAVLTTGTLPSCALPVWRATFIPYRFDLLEQIIAQQWHGLWLYGAGGGGLALAQQLAVAREEGWAVPPLRGFLDRCPEDYAGQKLGLPVKVPNRRTLNECEGIVIATMAWLEVHDELIEAGFNPAQILIGL